MVLSVEIFIRQINFYSMLYILSNYFTIKPQNLIRMRHTYPASVMIKKLAATKKLCVLENDSAGHLLDFVELV